MNVNIEIIKKQNIQVHLRATDKKKIFVLFSLTPGMQGFKCQSLDTNITQLYPSKVVF